MAFRLRITDTIDRRPFPDSPVSLEPGLRLCISGLRYVDGVAGGRLDLTYRVPSRYAARFQDIVGCMYLIVENAQTGEAVTRALVDPFSRIDEQSQPRYLGSSASDRLDGDTRGFASTQIEIDAPPPTMAPCLFVTAVLHDNVSNTLALTLGPTAASYLEGQRDD